MKDPSSLMAASAISPSSARNTPSVLVIPARRLQAECVLLLYFVCCEYAVAVPGVV